MKKLKLNIKIIIMVQVYFKRSKRMHVMSLQKFDKFLHNGLIRHISGRWVLIK